MYIGCKIHIQYVSSNSIKKPGALGRSRRFPSIQSSPRQSPWQIINHKHQSEGRNGLWYPGAHETNSGQVLGLTPEILKMSVPRPFWPGSGPKARNAQNEPPEPYSGQVLGLAPEMLKMRLLRPILAIFWPSGQNHSKWGSWGLFWLGSGIIPPMPSKLYVKTYAECMIIPPCLANYT